MRQFLVILLISLAISRGQIFYPDTYSSTKLSRIAVRRSTPFFLRLPVPLVPGAKWQMLPYNTMMATCLERSRLGTHISPPNNPKLLGSAGWSQFAFRMRRAGTFTVSFAFTCDITPGRFHTVVVTAR